MTAPRRSVSDTIPPVTTQRRKASGPSTGNKQRGFILREREPGQIEAWTAAALRAGLTLSEWIRRALDRAAKQERSG